MSGLLPLCEKIVPEHAKVLYEETTAASRTALSLGRMAVGVELFFEELAKLEKNNPDINSDGSTKWARDIEGQLNSKGCKMPATIKALITEMKTVGLDGEKMEDEPDEKKIKTE